MQKSLQALVLSLLMFSALYPSDLIGTVTFIGKPPKLKSIRMVSDPACGSLHQGPLYNQSFIVDEKGNLANVIVYLNTSNFSPSPPSDPLVLDQIGCTYSPHVVGIQVGQELTILNSDQTLHNVHGLPKENPPFNFGMPKTVRKKSIIFRKAEGVFVIKCDVHPWMKSYIQVFNHPYFAITTEDGKYFIPDIPPGNYEVIAWQEKFGSNKTLKKSVAISDQPTTLDFIFKRPDN